MPHNVPWRVMCGAAVVAAAVFAMGCASSRTKHVELPDPLELAESEEATPPESVSLDPMSPGLRPTASPEGPTIVPPTSTGQAATVVNPPPPRPTISSTPRQVSASPQRPTERVPIDAMVGEINGRPLFASDFFTPMDARLRAEAERRTPEEWLRFARTEIQQALRDRIRDELLLAEVQASLSPEQRAGVVNFVRTLRQNLISESRGSKEFAERRFLEEEGLTLEQAVQARRDEELIRSWLRQILQHKIYVPWRDIRQRYERDFLQYNPPDTAVFRVIRVRASSDVAVESVTTALEQGEPFEEIATQFSNYEANNNNRFESLMPASEDEEAVFFAPENLNSAAQQLEVGDWAGPIEVGSSLYWIKLEEIRVRRQSLYDVQIAIKQQLFGERVRTAEQEYFEKLLERSGLGHATREIQRIETRLFEIAADRYLLTKLN